MDIDDRTVDNAPVPVGSLRISELDDNVVLVTAVGTVAAGHGCDLWSMIEGALEVAMGRTVAADLSKVTAFDADTIFALSYVAGACTRRRLDLCAVIPPNSRLARDARARGLERHLLIHPSLAEAITTVRNGSCRGLLPAGSWREPEMLDSLWPYLQQ